MLQYNKNNTSKNSVITRIGDFIDIVPAMEAIQPYLAVSVEELIKSRNLTFDKNGFCVNDLIYFKADDNGNFIWPKKYPLRFKDSVVWNSKINVPRDAKNVDVSGGVIPRCPTLRRTKWKNAKKLNVSGGDTSHCKYLLGTFNYYKNLKCLDLSTGDLTKVESASEAFAYMSSLEQLLFNEKGLPSLTITMRMFFNSGKPKAKLDLSNTKTGIITRAEEMFKFSHFGEIDLRGWKFSEDCTFTEFAYGCDKLQIFNGVKLRDTPFKPTPNAWIDYTNLCIDIIKNPDNYEQYLVK